MEVLDYVVYVQSCHVADNMQVHKSEDMNYPFLSAFTNFNRLHKAEENDHVTF